VTSTTASSGGYALRLSNFMKKRFTVLFLIFLTKMLTASPESFFETTYRNAVAENLRFLDGKFPNKPGKGYPWLSVTINHQRAILICPEDGLGDALLVFEDGSVNVNQLDQKELG
jgi:hypothetical protein